MSWIHLESGFVNDQRLELYQSADDFMIRVNGLELMNSRCYRSEKMLAQAARRCVLGDHPRILIGGLGLGYTLAAFLEEFNQAELLVAEQSADVLRWYRTYFSKNSIGRLDDSRVQFFNRDVQEVMDQGTGFDLIVLDVDNGPQAVSGSSNATLYLSQGLRKIHGHLQEDGALILWSAFESEDFVRTAREAGFRVFCCPVNIGHRDLQHFIFCCLKRGSGSSSFFIDDAWEIKAPLK